MPPSNDFGASKRGSVRKKDANCSFCRKSYRDVGPLVEGPGGDHVYTLNVQFFRMTEESAEEPAGSATNH